MRFLKIRYAVLGLLLAIMLYVGIIPIKLAMARSQIPEPQAIFMLGGGRDREEFTAHLANLHPDLKVWISTGSQPNKTIKIFKEAGVPLPQLHLDYRAVDTVTNFTTMQGVFEKKGIQHVYLVTSDFHMRRSRAIAFFVFGSRGIVCTPVVVPSRYRAESALLVMRDGMRSLIWLLTKRTGAHLGNM